MNKEKELYNMNIEELDHVKEECLDYFKDHDVEIVSDIGILNHLQVLVKLEEIKALVNKRSTIYYSQKNDIKQKLQQLIDLKQLNG
jgi:ethanolamine utilization cobalamin adenosyltransferase